MDIIAPVAATASGLTTLLLLYVFLKRYGYELKGYPQKIWLVINSSLYGAVPTFIFLSYQVVLPILISTLILVVAISMDGRHKVTQPLGSLAQFLPLVILVTGAVGFGEYYVVQNYYVQSLIDRIVETGP